MCVQQHLIFQTDSYFGYLFQEGWSRCKKGLKTRHVFITEKSFMDKHSYFILRFFLFTEISHPTQQVEVTGGKIQWPKKPLWKRWQECDIFRRNFHSSMLRKMLVGNFMAHHFRKKCHWIIYGCSEMGNFLASSTSNLWFKPQKICAGKTKNYDARGVTKREVHLDDALKYE